MTKEPSEAFRGERLLHALARLSPERPFEVIFKDGANISVELYRPVGEDRQQPHTRDELYIVAEGSGVFHLDGEKISFCRGDMLFAPSRTPHRFEEFSDDFSCWIIFYGPEK